jgi:hypothetical protein
MKERSLIYKLIKDNMEESKEDNPSGKLCQVDHAFGDLTSLPAIDTITSIYSFSNIDSSSMMHLPDFKKLTAASSLSSPSIYKSQSIYTALSFLRRSQVIQL